MASTPPPSGHAWKLLRRPNQYAAQAERSLSASLKSMTEMLAEKEAALQRLATLHSRLLNQHEALAARLADAEKSGPSGKCDSQDNGGSQAATASEQPAEAGALVPSGWKEVAHIDPEASSAARTPERATAEAADEAVDALATAEPPEAADEAVDALASAEPLAWEWRPELEAADSWMTNYEDEDEDEPSPPANDDEPLWVTPPSPEPSTERALLGPPGSASPSQAFLEEAALERITTERESELRELREQLQEANGRAAHWERRAAELEHSGGGGGGGGGGGEAVADPSPTQLASLRAQLSEAVARADAAEEQAVELRQQLAAAEEATLALSASQANEELAAECARLRAAAAEAVEREAEAVGAMEGLQREVESLQDAQDKSRRALASQMWELREKHHSELAKLETALKEERARNKQVRTSLNLVRSNSFGKSAPAIAVKTNDADGTQHAPAALTPSSKPDSLMGSQEMDGGEGPAEAPAAKAAEGPGGGPEDGPGDGRRGEAPANGLAQEEAPVAAAGALAPAEALAPPPSSRAPLDPHHHSNGSNAAAVVGGVGDTASWDEV